MKFDRQKVTELARREIMAGKPREDVFMDIYSSYNDPSLHEPIAKIVQYIPEPERIKKYGVINSIFMVLLAAINIACILTFENLYLTILPLILLFLVATRQLRHYHWITFCGGLAIIISVTMLITGEPGGQGKPFAECGLAAATGVIFILFGIYMPKLLTPDYKVVEETTTDSDGNTVTKKKIVF